jgi:thioredoxin 1
MNLSELKQQLKQSPRPAVIDFWAPWCAPCLVSKPILEELAREYKDKVDFQAINADEHPDLMRELHIFGIPTVLLTRNGEIISKYTGSQPREIYRIMFEALTHPNKTVTVPMSAFDRYLRLLAGTAIALVGVSASAWFLILIGAVIAFWGVYDRCPIWRAITSALIKKTP